MCLRSSFTLDGEINGLAGAFLCTVENTLADFSRLYGADLDGEQGAIGIANKICITRKLIQNLLLDSNPCTASSGYAKEERCRPRGNYRRGFSKIMYLLKTILEAKLTRNIAVTNNNVESCFIKLYSIFHVHILNTKECSTRFQILWKSFFTRNSPSI